MRTRSDEIETAHIPDATAKFRGTCAFTKLYARHVGRVGALAVALGVGAAIASCPGVASAQDDEGSARAAESVRADPPTRSERWSEGEAETGSSGGDGTGDSSNGGVVDHDEEVDEAAEGVDEAAEGVGEAEEGVDEAEADADELPTSAEPGPAERRQRGGSGDEDAAPVFATPKNPVDSEGDTVTIDAEPIVEKPMTIEYVPQLNTPEIRLGVAEQGSGPARQAFSVSKPESVPASVVSDVFATLVSPFTWIDPTAPVESPLIWVFAAAARRQFGLVSEVPQALVGVTADAEDFNSDPTGRVSVGRPSRSTGKVRGSVIGRDADRDALQYSAPATSAKGGIVTIDTRGRFTYVPTAEVRHAAAAAGATAEVKTDTFIVTIDDGQGGTVGVPVSVKIRPANARPDGATASLGAPDTSTGAVVGSVTATDADGDEFTLSGPASTRKGSIVYDSAADTFTYTPTPGALEAAGSPRARTSTKTDRFTVAVNDGHGGTDTVRVRVEITPITGSTNDAPIAGTPSPGDPESRDGAITGTLGFSDPDGDALTYVVTTNPTKGLAGVDAAGNFTYTPTQAARLEAAVAGMSDSFIVTAEDGRGGSATVTVDVTVDPARIGADGPIPVGTGPYGIAVTADGSRVYVTNIGDNTVSLIDTATRTSVVAAIPVGLAPMGVAISADGSRIYVANSGESTITVIDTGTHTIVGAPITVGNAPTAIALSPNGARLYVANSGGNSVSVVDTAANAVIGTPIPVGVNPFGIAVSPDGARVYVSNVDDDTISVIDAATSAVVGSPIVVGDSPESVIVSHDGRHVYVANADDDTVTVINTATHTVVGAAIAVGDTPFGLALSADGSRLYVTNLAADTVTVINTATNTTIGDEIAVGATPFQVAVAADGTAYVANLGDNSVSAVGLVSQIAPIADDAPVVQSVSGSTGTVSGAVGFSDPTGSDLTYTVSEAPNHGTVTLQGDGSYTYTPIDAARQAAAGVAMTDTFTVSASNGRTATARTVTVNVIPSPSVIARIAVDPDQNWFVTGVFVTPDNKRMYVVAEPSNYTIPGTVTVVDLTTNTVMGSPITIGSSPHAAVMSQDGQHVYVAAGTGIWSIDTTTNVAISSTGSLYHFPVDPQSMVVNSDDTRLYIVNGLRGEVSIVDTATMTRIGDTVVVGSPRILPNGDIGAPYHYVSLINRDGDRLYVMVTDDPNNKAIQVIDGHTTLPPITFSKFPQFMDLTSDGSRLIVGLSDSSLFPAIDSIAVIDTRVSTANNPIVDYVNLDVELGDAMLSPDGTRLYGRIYNGSEAVATVDTLTGELVGTPIAMSQYPTLRLSDDGRRLYGTVGYDNTFVTINTTNNKLVAAPFGIGDADQGTYGIGGVTLSPDGQFAYVFNRNDSAITVIDTTTVNQPVDTEAPPIVDDAYYGKLSPGSVGELYERLRRYTEDARSGVYIETIVDEWGYPRQIVYIGGTVPISLVNQALMKNLPAYSGEVDDAQTRIIDAVLAQYPDSPIMLVGYSQGGLDAQNIAASGAYPYVTTVVTFASPIIKPHSVGYNTIHLVAEGDPIPALSHPLHDGDYADADIHGQLFEVDSGVVDWGLGLHGNKQTYKNVGDAFEESTDPRFDIVKEDIARYLGRAELQLPDDYVVVDGTVLPRF